MASKLNTVDELTNPMPINETTPIEYRILVNSSNFLHLSAMIPITMQPISPKMIKHPIHRPTAILS